MDKLRKRLSSNSCEWSTPQDLFDQLDREFNFTLDVCATAQNAKCRRYYSPQQDGLLQPWTGTCWLNPPYGRQVKRWIKKAYISARLGSTIVCLVPARTDTAWWHEYAMAGEIRFIRGRLRFGGETRNCPFPSAIIVFSSQILQKNTAKTFKSYHQAGLFV